LKAPPVNNNLAVRPRKLSHKRDGVNEPYRRAWIVCNFPANTSEYLHHLSEMHKGASENTDFQSMQTSADGCAIAIKQK
jgi:hypothetical protein